MALIAFIGLVLASVSPLSSAMKQPGKYEANQCELVAKDFQKEFGGSLVFIQPLRADGSYDLCDYCGHWINKKYVSGNQKEYFFDYGLQKIFSSKNELKNQYGNVAIFELDKEHPPFAIIYHY